MKKACSYIDHALTILFLIFFCILIFEWQLDFFSSWQSFFTNIFYFWCSQFRSSDSGFSFNSHGGKEMVLTPKLQHLSTPEVFLFICFVLFCLHMFDCIVYYISLEVISELRWCTVCLDWKPADFDPHGNICKYLRITFWWTLPA